MRANEIDALYHPRGADSYSCGVKVRVLRGDRKGQTGRVDATWADGGDMVHRVRFDDGATDDYDVAELMPRSSSEPNHHRHNN